MTKKQIGFLILVLALASTATWSAYSPGTFIVDSTGTVIAGVKGASTAPLASDNAVVVAISPNSIAPKTYGNANAQFSQASVTTATTISAPANAVRVMIQGDSSNTDCIRYRFDGTAATATVGMVAQPGQDSGQLDSGMAVSVVACSGTQKVNVQYFAQ